MSNDLLLILYSALLHLSFSMWRPRRPYTALMTMNIVEICRTYKRCGPHRENRGWPARSFDNVKTNEKIIYVRVNEYNRNADVRCLLDQKQPFSSIHFDSDAK